VPPPAATREKCLGAHSRDPICNRSTKREARMPYVGGFIAAVAKKNLAAP
jgi:hypothetical protein